MHWLDPDHLPHVGTAIEAKQIGAAKDATRSIKPKKPKHDKPAKHNGRVHA
jgi:hypothetical protein